MAKMNDLINGNRKVLLALLKYGESTISELKERAGMSLTGIYNSIRKLLDVGLIEEVRESKFPFRRMIRLTEKGRKIASLLEQLDSLI